VSGLEDLIFNHQTIRRRIFNFQDLTPESEIVIRGKVVGQRFPDGKHLPQPTAVPWVGDRQIEQLERR
jgi:hypothetical protein